MVQERAGERRLAPDSAAARMHRGPQRREVGHAGVRQFAALAPERFDGIELGGVAGQRFDLQPDPLRGEVAPHPTTLVRPQTIPDEHDGAATEMPFQGFMLAMFWLSNRRPIK